MFSLKSKILSLAIVLVLPSAALAADMPQRSLAVTGEGHVSAPPDMAVVRFAVQADEKTAQAAMARAALAATAALATLRAAGVAEADMQSSRIALYPRRNDHSSSGDTGPDGFTASLGVTVKLRQIESLGALLDALVAAGVTQIEGIEFSLQNPQPQLDTARERAVAEALRKAVLYASAAGVTLGPILQITEGGAQGGPQPMMMQADMARSAVPIAVGKTEITAQVNVIFALE